MLKTLLQGMVVGLANIIPGVSGGTMLVAMGAYDKLINSITHLFSNFKKSIKFLLPILLGAGLAILILARLFEYLLLNYPIPTNLAFCGLILGSLPFITAHVKGKKITVSCIICFALFFALVVVMALAEGTGTQIAKISATPLNMLWMCVIGIIAAATMVIPGVSGSMVLMLMGYYQPILALVNDFIDHVIHFNASALLYDCMLLVPFGIGVILGIFLIAKLIEWVLQKWEKQAYWAIIGLITASPVAILMRTDWGTFSILMLVIGIICFIGGWFAASKLGGE